MRWGLEITAADLEDVSYVGVHLGVNGEAGVERGRGKGDEAGCKFGLECEDAEAWRVGKGEEFEG